MRLRMRRSFKILLGFVGLLALSGLIYFAGGGTPLRMNKKGVPGPGKYEIAWVISTGQEIPAELKKPRDQQDESKVKWSAWRNWLIFPIRPEGGTLYRIGILWSPMMAEEWGYVNGPEPWTENPPHPHPHPNS